MEKHHPTWIARDLRVGISRVRRVRGGIAPMERDRPGAGARRRAIARPSPRRAGRPSGSRPIPCRPRDRYASGSLSAPKLSFSAGDPLFPNRDVRIWANLCPSEPVPSTTGIRLMPSSLLARQLAAPGRPGRRDHGRRLRDARGDRRADPGCGRAPRRLISQADLPGSAGRDLQAGIVVVLAQIADHRHQ